MIYRIITRKVYYVIYILIICNYSYGQYANDEVYVDRVIDGDTILIDSGEYIRLLGVNTPETVHPNREIEYYGPEASQYTKNTLENKYITIEYDYNNRDAFNRILAYVYLDNNIDFNAILIYEGYGMAYNKYYHPKIESYQNLEYDALINGRGIWSVNNSMEYSWSDFNELILRSIDLGIVKLRNNKTMMFIGVEPLYRYLFYDPYDYSDYSTYLLDEFESEVNYERCNIVVAPNIGDGTEEYPYLGYAGDINLYFIVNGLMVASRDRIHPRIRQFVLAEYNAKANGYGYWP